MQKIKKLYLKNFRNFEEKLLEFSENTTILIAPNASGKTNILEAIYVLSTGKSFKAQKIEEMVSFNEEIARVKALIQNSEEIKLEAILTRGKVKVGENPDRFEKITKKKLLVGGVAKRMIDFANNLSVVLFGPWDLDLVTESPGLRRRFLDEVLSQVDREYRRAISSYEKGLRRRNRLLVRIRDEGTSRRELAFWDMLLIKNGNYITQKRSEFVDYVNLQDSVGELIFELEYGLSSISETRLKQYKDEEVAAGTTLVGPHRDDIVFKIKKGVDMVDLASYGSRGEQRMGVLWTKLSELSFIKEKSGELPVFLLDDIFSELDHEHRKVVGEVVGNQQTIITTADKHNVEDGIVGKIVKL